MHRSLTGGWGWRQGGRVLLYLATYRSQSLKCPSTDLFGQHRALIPKLVQFERQKATTAIAAAEFQAQTMKLLSKQRKLIYSGHFGAFIIVDGSMCRGGSMGGAKCHKSQYLKQSLHFSLAWDPMFQRVSCHFPVQANWLKSVGVEKVIGPPEIGSSKC